MEHGENLFILFETVNFLRHFKHHLHFGTIFRDSFNAYNLFNFDFLGLYREYQMTSTFIYLGKLSTAVG